MGHFSDLMAIYCVTHSGTVSHRNCPLVTGPLDYGDPRGTGGIHRQTCPDVTQLLLIIQPVITKRRVLFIVQILMVYVSKHQDMSRWPYLDSSLVSDFYSRCPDELYPLTQ